MDKLFFVHYGYLFFRNGQHIAIKYALL